MPYTRREVGKMVAAAVPALLGTGRASCFADDPLTKPNSKWAGVQVGLNVPYSFGAMGMSGDEILDSCLRLGLSALELRSQPVEAFLGLPANLTARRGRAAGGQNPDEQAARRARAEELRKWRLAAPMEKVRAFRKKYEDAGVLIEIVKFDGIYALTDEEIDYSFALAKGLGAKAISCEISLEETRRLGQFADKHKLMVGYHGHASTKPADWETSFSYARYNGANLDLGHFVAGNNVSPVEFIKKHHDRITHVHVKDRKLNNGPNVPFGQGDTPLREVLRLMSREKYGFQATIEFEYPIPQGSDRMSEIAKSIQYCKECLA